VSKYVAMVSVWQYELRSKSVVPIGPRAFAPPMCFPVHAIIPYVLEISMPVSECKEFRSGGLKAKARSAQWRAGIEQGVRRGRGEDPLTYARQWQTTRCFSCCNFKLVSSRADRHITTYDISNILTYVSRSQLCVRLSTSPATSTSPSRGRITHELLQPAQHLYCSL
jgi:hypothetical protein